MLPEWFVYVAAGCSLFGTWRYGRDTLAGRIQPNRVTWALWGLMPMIAFAGQLSEGVGLPALTTFMVGAGPLAIFALSFANPAAYWKISRRDVACLGISLAALTGWVLTRDGLVAIALALAADFAAGLPTISKAWHRPDTETPAAFAGNALAAAITLASLTAWNFESASFSLLILSVDCTILLLLCFPRLGPGRPSEAALVAEAA